MQIRFDGKTVAVTGAGHGFGRTIAQTFAGLGARVFATDIDAAELAETAAPGGVATAAVDLRDRAAAAAWVRGIEQTAGGAIDVLVNNAGGVAGQEHRPLEDVSDADWDVIFAISVDAAFTLCRAAAPAMKRAGGGRIVNISSESGRFRAGITTGPYAMSKHALEAYSDALRQELQFVGVPVVVIEPGSFRSAMSHDIPERLAASVPPGSPFEPIVTFTERTSAREEKHARDPKILARAVYHAVTSRRPRPRYLVKGGIQSRILDVLPRTAADWIVKMVVR